MHTTAPTLLLPPHPRVSSQNPTIGAIPGRGRVAPLACNYDHDKSDKPSPILAKNLSTLGSGAEWTIHSHSRMTALWQMKRIERLQHHGQHHNTDLNLGSPTKFQICQHVVCEPAEHSSAQVFKREKRELHRGNNSGEATTVASTFARHHSTCPMLGTAATVTFSISTYPTHPRYRLELVMDGSNTILV